MQNRTPIYCQRCGAAGERGEDDFAALEAIPDFEPVPRKYRHDGWTAQRQRDFIARLAETGSVKHAAKAINMSPEGAYYLRRQPGAEGFRRAWEVALDYGVRRLLDVTMERALHGVPMPIFWRGEQVGEKRRYNDRLAMFHLRHRLPDRYGPLRPPAGGTKSPETLQREAWERQAEWERETEEARMSMKTRIDAIHRHWRAGLAEVPGGLAAYELLFGVDGADERDLGQGLRLGRLPPALAYHIIGVEPQD
jgi:hypothetical protein